MCCGRCGGRGRTATKHWRSRIVDRFDVGDGIDYGLGASFGPLVVPEVRERDQARLAQLLRPPQVRPPGFQPVLPRIAFGEVKSQAGINEGLLQLRERLNRQARATPANRPLRNANVGLAWYMPAAPGQPNLVRYMVANAGGDPRQDRRLWQGNLGYIPPVPTNLVPGGSTPAQARDLEAHWRENQVRLLLQRMSGQQFRPQPLNHGGADLVRRFDDYDGFDRGAFDDVDALDAAIDAGLDSMLAALAR